MPNVTSAQIAQVVADTIQLLSRRSFDSTATNTFDGTTWSAPGVTASRDITGIGRAAANLAAWSGTPSSARKAMVDLAQTALQMTLTGADPQGYLPAAGVAGHIGLCNAAEIAVRLMSLGVTVPDSTISALTHAGEITYSGSPGHGAEWKWYTNGNVELFEALSYWLLYRLTGQQLWRDRFNAQWQFALYPGSRWPGYGLQLTFTPALPLADALDWRSHQGYLAEAGAAGVPGFDADYSAVHADVLTRLLVATQGYVEQADVVRIANTVTNQLLARTNRSSSTYNGVPAWCVDGRGGTRITASLAVLRAPSIWWLVAQGSRTDLVDAPGMMWTTNLKRLWTVDARTFPLDALHYSRLGEMSTVLLTGV